MESAAAVYVPVTPDEETHVGDSFRIKFHVRSHFDVRTVNKVVSALKLGAGLVDTSPFTKMTGFWRIDDITAYSEAYNDAVPISSSGNYEDWTLQVDATRFQGGTPLLVVAGAIVAVLVALGGLIVVTGWTAEKVSKEAKPFVDIIPAVLIGGFIVAMLILTRR